MTTSTTGVVQSHTIIGRWRWCAIGDIGCRCRSRSHATVIGHRKGDGIGTHSRISVARCCTSSSIPVTKIPVIGDNRSVCIGGSRAVEQDLITQGCRVRATSVRCWRLWCIGITCEEIGNQLNLCCRQVNRTHATKIGINRPLYSSGSTAGLGSWCHTVTGLTVIHV